MEEIWKDIRGFEGRYQVSNMGRVRYPDQYRTRVYQNGTIATIRIRKAGFKQLIERDGYVTVALNMTDAKHTPPVDKLVAEHFCEGYKRGLVVNHKDENPSNNRADNLEWCTQHYNQHYGTAIERAAKAQWKGVAQYDSNGNLIATYKSGKEASEKTGFHRACISDWCRKAHPCKAGFVWEFI